MSPDNTIIIHGPTLSGGGGEGLKEDWHVSYLALGVASCYRVQ